MWTGSDDVGAFRGDGDYAHCLVVTAEFSQQIKIILTGVRVAGDKYHHWVSDSVQDKFGNPHVELSLYTKVFLPKSDSFAILKMTLSNNHIKNRLETGTHQIFIWLNENAPVYSSTGSLPEISQELSSLGTPLYSGPVRLEEKEVFAGVSLLAPAVLHS